MNSWSKNDYETSIKEYKKEDRYEPCRKEDRCKEKIHEEKRCDTFVKCGASNSTIVPEAAPLTSSFTLATLNLDTSCICDPKIKLDFTSNYALIFSGVASTSIRLQVFRQCKNELNPVAIGPSWNLSLLVPITATFSFFICDEDVCRNEDCCTYTVVATPTVAGGGLILFNNATLAATVTCGENQCKKRCNCHN